MPDEDYEGGYTHLAEPIPRATPLRPAFLENLTETQRQLLLFVAGGVVGFVGGYFVGTRRR